MRWLLLAVGVALLGVGGLRFALARHDDEAGHPIAAVDPGVGPFYHPEDEPTSRLPRGTRVHHPLLEAVRRNWVRGTGVFPIGPAGWKARMAALCGLAGEGKRAIPTLVAALDDTDPRVRALAAQALGIVGGRSEAGVLDAMLLGDPDAECRVAAAHARSMVGDMRPDPRYDWSLRLDRLFSFREHLQFALDRGPEPRPAALGEAYARYDLAEMDTAHVGGPAPDFALLAVDGRSTIRLADVLDRSDVILTFIYGST